MQSALHSTLNWAHKPDQAAATPYSTLPVCRRLCQRLPAAVVRSAAGRNADQLHRCCCRCFIQQTALRVRLQPFSPSTTTSSPTRAWPHCCSPDGDTDNCIKVATWWVGDLANKTCTAALCGAAVANAGCKSDDRIQTITELYNVRQAACLRAEAGGCWLAFTVAFVQLMHDGFGWQHLSWTWATSRAASLRILSYPPRPAHSPCLPLPPPACLPGCLPAAKQPLH